MTVTVTVTAALGATTATASAVVDRNLLAAGVDKPGPGSVGLLPGVPRRTATPAEIAPGAVITDADLPFRVNSPAIPTGATRQAATITLRNCHLMGPATAPTGVEGLAVVTAANACPVAAVDCLLRPQHPHWLRVGIQGHDYTLTRCELAYCQDGAEVFNTYAPDAPTGVTIRQCWFHDFAYWRTGTTLPADGSHDDAIQIEGGTGTTVDGNWVQAYVSPESGTTYYGDTRANTCLMIKPDVGNIAGLTITRNWLEGGRIGIITSKYDRDTTGTVTRQITDLGVIAGNRCKRGSFGLGGGNAAISANMVKDTAGVWRQVTPADYTATIGPNVWDDTADGTVPITNGGAP